MSGYMLNHEEGLTDEGAYELPESSDKNKPLTQKSIYRFVFVYILNDKYKVLNIDEAKIKGKDLIKEGWTHIATLDSAIWLESFLNESMTDKIDIIKDLK